MENLPACSEQWISWSTAIISFILFLASELLGVVKGKGTCSSLIQLCVSIYHQIKGKNVEPQRESAEWLAKV